MTYVIIIHSLLQLYHSLTVTHANTTDVILYSFNCYSFTRLRHVSFLFIREITTDVILILSPDYDLRHSYSFTRLRLVIIVH